jgi:type IV pilus assembly protein PilM
MADTVVGLMIVEECVRAVEVRRPASKNPTLIRYGEAALPPGAAGDSEIIDSDAVALALRQLWAETKFSTKRVVLGLGNRRILVRDHRAPLLRPDQLRRALPFQVQDMLPVPVEEAVLDFHPVSQEGDEVRGLLVAAVADMVTGVIDTVRKARLSVDTVDLAPFGLVRAAARCVDPDKTVLVAHVGAHTSYLVVMRGGAPLLVRIVPAGVPIEQGESGRHRAELDELVAVGTPVPAGAGQQRPPDDRVVEEFAMRVRSTADFYTNRAGAALDEMYVCGEGGCHRQVLPALDRIVGLPSRVLTIDDVLSSADSVDTDTGCLSLVTPVGLALRGGS